MASSTVGKIKAVTPITCGERGPRLNCNSFEYLRRCALWCCGLSSVSAGVDEQAPHFRHATCQCQLTQQRNEALDAETPEREKVGRKKMIQLLIYNTIQLKKKRSNPPHCRIGAPHICSRCWNSATASRDPAVCAPPPPPMPTIPPNPIPKLLLLAAGYEERP